MAYAYQTGQLFLYSTSIHHQIMKKHKITDNIFVYGQEGSLDGAYSSIKALDLAYALMKTGRLNIITSAQFAKARILVGKEHPLCQSGGWVGECYSYWPNGDLLIAQKKYNPILRATNWATESHKRKLRFSINSLAQIELRDRAEKDPVKAMQTGVLLVPGKKIVTKFPTKNLENYEVPYFLFQKNAKDYGEFLYNLGISTLTQNFGDKSYFETNIPYAKQFYISGLKHKSNLTLLVDHDWKARMYAIRHETNTKTEILDLNSLDHIVEALYQEKPFDYNGKTYVPVNTKEIYKKKAQ